MSCPRCFTLGWVFVLVLCWGGMVWTFQAQAGAWPAPQGHGQIILKADQFISDPYDGLDHLGEDPVRLRSQRTTLEVYGDYGLTPGLTLTGQSAYGVLKENGLRAQKVEGAIGGRLLILRIQGLEDRAKERREQDWVVSVGLVGGMRLGDEQAFRVREILPLSKREQDPKSGWRSQGYGEAQLFLGHSGKVLSKRYYFDVSYGRRIYEAAADQDRINFISGVELRKNLWALSQLYMGREAIAGGARWITHETGFEYRKGAMSYQIGWRKVMDGTSVRRGEGLVLGLWRRF